MTASPQSDELLSTIRKITRAISMHSKALLRDYGLTGPQLMILTAISKSSQSTVTEVARRVSLSQATVTSILGRLEQQGFVVRRRSETDKRKVYIRTTEKTLRVLESGPSLLQVDFVNRFDRLKDWEKSLLVSSLQRIAAMMDAEEIASAPTLYGDVLGDAEQGKTPE